MLIAELHQHGYVTVFLLLTFLIPSAFAQDRLRAEEGIKLLDWIGHNGVEIASISDDLIFDAVESGLSSGDSQIVSATVGALAWIAAYARLSTDDRRSTQSLSRDVGSISGLKEYLLHLWEREFRKNSTPWIGSDKTQFVEIRNSKTVWRSEWAWLTIPAILATFYPRDPDVVEVLWQANHPRYPELLLSLLNVGEFETKEASNFRVQTLFNLNVSPVATVLAIDGLGRFRTAGGLAALVRRLTSTDVDHDLATILLKSIAAYDDEVKPYKSVISKKTVELSIEFPDDAEPVNSQSDELVAYLLFIVQNGFEETTLKE